MAVDPSSSVSWYTRFVDTIALSSDTRTRRRGSP